MRSTYITALIIATLIVVWLFSGLVDEPDVGDPASLAESKRAQSSVGEDGQKTRVRVAVQDAVEQYRYVTVRGKTENKRTVAVKTELEGTVVERPVDRGSVVEQGDLLCKLSLEDRAVALAEARASLDQARIDFKGTQQLQEKGYTSDSGVAAAKARLAAAEANLSRRQLDHAKIQVKAPFSGVVEDVHLEVGDFVNPGAPCATIVDMDPMLLVGRVSEKDVGAVQTGQIATGRLVNAQANKREIAGAVTFVGQQSDPSTRTYALEIEVANPDHALRSGITTEIRIPVGSVMAHNVSPALFSLDDEGVIGIRTVTENNIVEFHRVDILADAPQGVWVTGLPHRAAIIVVGHELVTPGERVEPAFQGNPTLPAKSTDKSSDTQPSAPSAGVAAAMGAHVTGR